MSNRSCINLVANTTFGQNVGDGCGVYKGKINANTLQLKSISATGSSVQILSDDDNIYISGVTAGESYSFTNGLTETSGTVKLGGTLTGTTTLSFGSSYFKMYPSTSDFDLFASDGTNYTNVYSSLSSIFNSMQAGSGSTYSEIRTCLDKVQISSDVTNDYGVTFDCTGAYYNKDFSGTYTDRHLVDVAYVSGLTGGGVGTLQQVTDSGSTTTNSIVIGGGTSSAGGQYSLAQGFNAIASGLNSHAEGANTTASCDYAHAEGCGTLACGGEAAHAEGADTVASGWYSHAEGKSTLASGNRSHAQNCNTCACGDDSHAEGIRTKATGFTSHAEGIESVAGGSYTHAEGYQSKALGGCSHAEGVRSCVTGLYGHAEGYETFASGSEAAHAEGYLTTASGWYSHAEGRNTLASGNRSHAEGCLTCAVGDNSHAEGVGTKATGSTSHAEGGSTCAIGQYSHAEGYQTLATGYSSHVSGQFNSPKAGSIFEIGIGADVGNRCNVFEAYCVNYVTINDVLRLNPSSTPSTPLEGMIYYDSTANKLKVYNGSSWETVTST